MAVRKAGSRRKMKAGGVGWALLTALLVNGCAHPVPDGHGAVATTSAADSWLQVQRGGSQASPVPQRLSPREQELANQRWLESFTHPIPERYARDSAGGFSVD